MRIGLVGCVKGKASTARSARDLYESPLFGGRRAYVIRSCDRWFILSARHGLVEPSTVLEPYDDALQDVSRGERRRWARLVIGQLVSTLSSVRDQTFEIHAGNAYTGFGLTSGLIDMGARVELPGAGLPIGRLLAFYAGGDGAWRSGTGTIREGATSADEPLRAYLSDYSSPVTITFADIEAIIGRTLPSSARKHRAWWENSTDRTLARQWLAAGWRADMVDLSGQRIRLVR